MKRFIVPAVAGVVVFSAASAFAASLTVNGGSLGAGNGTVASCNASATVTYTTAYDATVPGYEIATAPVTTAAGCNGRAYKVTLTGAANASLGEVSGTLDASGNATPNFASSNIAASAVTGVSVVISG